jgi:hypothetical protein
MWFLILIIACLGYGRVNLIAQDKVANEQKLGYEQWRNGPSSEKDFFPIAVWLQSPRNADRYSDLGINTYVGLWRGPTDEQLLQLKKAGMKVICSQNDLALKSANNDVIIGWMHGDEPDNAQPKSGGGYGPPIEPAKIEADYKELKRKDSTRPIFLNLGQGVAFDKYIGRGVRTNHPEDYADYLKGSDIASFDIYPAVHEHADVAGKLEFVPRGVRRLREWSDESKIIWNCIECSRISNPEKKPTPAQLRSEVWMSLIAGSRGIIYFVHQFKPTFQEASLFNDPELLAEVTRVNRAIAKLAPVLNSASLPGVEVSSKDQSAIKYMLKKYQGACYVFIANESTSALEARVNLKDIVDADSVCRTVEGDTGFNWHQSNLELSLPGYGVAILSFESK